MGWRGRAIDRCNRKGKTSSRWSFTLAMQPLEQ